MGYDVIGDGQDGKLQALLGKLGYHASNGAYRHPQGRTAVFVGDLIDRGPGQVEVVDIARRMIDAGSARVVMGNHEFNAIGYATPDGEGDYLRKHSPKNEAQHAEFLRQVGWDSSLHRDLVKWFKTLPVALDLGGIRVCHAWWNPDHVAAVAQASDTDGQVDEAFLLGSFQRTGPGFDAMEGLTKGLEMELPDGSSFVDHAGNVRLEIRVRWWDNEATSYRAAALLPEDQRHCVPDIPLPDGALPGNCGPTPVFVGHYWLSSPPAVQNAKTAVLDYGAGTDGPLVAYRWSGETELGDDAFVAAGA